MYYIHENTDYVKIECYNLSTEANYKTMYLYGHVDYDPKDLDQYHENWNNEVNIENIGQKMDIEFEIFNNENINSQSDVVGMIRCIGLVKAGTHRIAIYPSYNANVLIETLDRFDCIIRGSYKIKNLVQSVSSGNSITILFQEYSPDKTFVPKVPNNDVSTVPTNPGGLIYV